MDVPELTDDFVNRVGDQCEAQARGRTPRDLERIRDDNLVAITRALKLRDWGAGAVANAQEARLTRCARLPRRADEIEDPAQTVPTLRRAVPVDWLDYNGHMTEARYLDAFAQATDRLMEIVGCDQDYIATGGSFFTAETHIRHMDEINAGTRIHVDTICLNGQGKKMHVFHQLWAGDRLCATGEHMLIHVSLQTRRPSDPSDQIARRLGTIAEAHHALPRPNGVGRSVGAPR
jgi:carnitine 3-dehydrogenase